MGTKRVGLARTQALIENLKRELQMNNSTFKGTNEKIVSVTAATTLTKEQSGAVIHWTHSSAHDITLPTATVGLNYTILLLAGAAANHYIVSAASDKIFGKAVVLDNADDKLATQVVLKGSALDKVHMHKTSNNTGGDAGDTVRLTCCEAGYWVCEANLLTTGTPTSIATLTD